MKPNKAHLRLWVKALRSGKYKQTIGHLRDDHGYCCLGVACDVFRKEVKKGKWSEGYFRYLNDYAMSHLHPSIATWLGINIDPILSVGRQKLSAIECNDTYKHDFSTIADAIEKTFSLKRKKVSK